MPSTAETNKKFCWNFGKDVLEHCTTDEHGLSVHKHCLDRHMTHTSPEQHIDDLCLQIQGERDKHKLLKLIDQLDGLLVKEG